MDAAHARRPWGPAFDTWQSLFAFVYRGLATGVCVTAFALPLAVALIGLASPWTAVPFLLLCALPLGPALSAAFWAFGEAQRSGGTTPFAHFWRGLATTGRRGLGVWAIALALLLFLYVDVLAVAATPFALLLGPLFAVLGVVVIAATPIALTALALPSRPGVLGAAGGLGVLGAAGGLGVLGAAGGLGALGAAGGLGVLGAAKAGLYTALRRPLLSLLTLLVLGAWTLILLAQPVIGALALGGFALTLVWMNAAGQLAAVAEASEA